MKTCYVCVAYDTKIKDSVSVTITTLILGHIFEQK